MEDLLRVINIQEELYMVPYLVLDIRPEEAVGRVCKVASDLRQAVHPYGLAQVCEYKLEAKHFEEALKKVKPTASEEEIYKRFAQAKAA